MRFRARLRSDERIREQRRELGASSLAGNPQLCHVAKPLRSNK